MSVESLSAEWASETEKPNCFGYSTTYTEGHAVCEACPFNAECSSHAKSMIERLREELGVNAILNRKKKEKQAAPKVATQEDLRHDEMCFQR